MDVRTPLLILMLMSIALLGACDGGGHESHESPPRETGREVLYWYDPMHPEQRFDEPGPSPFMDMDLVPRYADEADGARVNVAPGIQQVMNLRTTRARRGSLPRIIETVGHVGYDQSRLMHIQLRVEGWIEETHVNAVGEQITEGQLLFTLYSTELVNAQEDLLQALRRGADGTVEAARERLRALGVQDEVMTELERRGTALRAVPWLARHDGVVTELGVRRGMFVGPGQVLLETVDLSRIWLTADVFDRHADWLAPGQRAEVTIPYMPGEMRHAEIEHIYPQLDDATRTVRVRLPMDNPDTRLKPGMWSAVRIFANALDDVLMIPREALIRSGHAARVVLREDGQRFEVRQVVAGMESGDWVEIREGLAADEEIVTSGQFLLDSEAALRGGLDRLKGAEHQH
ncbi:MAG: efflux RND transporter periplasmic adaptor subunit [Gammaproteobacteria bacterium]|nr:efflux RND transporter periplasmic adaptor subunit [Gammaproteobacteria bacterium]